MSEGLIERESADLVFVIEAGNNVKDSVISQQIYEQAIRFYKRLRIIFPSDIL